MSSYGVLHARSNGVENVSNDAGVRSNGRMWDGEGAEVEKFKVQSHGDPSWNPVFLPIAARYRRKKPTRNYLELSWKSTSCVRTLLSGENLFFKSS